MLSLGTIVAITVLGVGALILAVFFLAVRVSAHGREIEDLQRRLALVVRRLPEPQPGPGAVVKAVHAMLAAGAAEAAVGDLDEATVRSEPASSPRPRPLPPSAPWTPPVVMSSDHDTVDEEEEDEVTTFTAKPAAPSAPAIDIGAVLDARNEARDLHRETVDPAAARVRAFREVAERVVKDFRDRIRQKVTTIVVANVTEADRESPRYMGKVAYVFSRNEATLADEGGDHVMYDFVAFARVNTDTIIGFAVNTYGTPDRLLAATATVAHEPRRVVSYEVHEEITYSVDGAYVKALLDKMAAEVL